MKKQKMHYTAKTFQGEHDSNPFSNETNPFGGHKATQEREITIKEKKRK